jgi:flagellar protein FliO/FliZ
MYFLLTDLPVVPEVTEFHYGSTFIKMILSLVFLIVLMWATVWLLRRLMNQKLLRGSSQSMLHVIEKKMLSPKTMLYVVEVEGDKIVIAESQLEIKTLHSLKTERSEPK